MTCKTRPACAILIGVVLCVLSGCITHKAPRLEISDTVVVERTEAGMVVDFVIDATNENSFELPLAQLRYTVWLDGQRVFRGVRSPEATLRRYGSQSLRLPVAIPSTIDLPSSVVEYRIEGRLSYRRPGALAEVLFDAGVITPSKSYSGRGQMDLREVVSGDG